MNNLVALLLMILFNIEIKDIKDLKKVWLRATGSTLVSQFIDSFVVLFIAFYVAPRISGSSASWPFSQVMAICVGNYIYKFIVAVMLTPVIYLVHGWIDRYMGKTLSTQMKQAAIGHPNE